MRSAGARPSERSSSRVEQGRDLLENSKDREAGWATVWGCKELAMTEQLTHTYTRYILHNSVVYII